MWRIREILKGFKRRLEGSTANRTSLPKRVRPVREATASGRKVTARSPSARPLISTPNFGPWDPPPLAHSVTSASTVSVGKIPKPCRIRTGHFRE